MPLFSMIGIVFFLPSVFGAEVFAGEKLGWKSPMPNEWSCECDPWNGCGKEDTPRPPDPSDYTKCPPEKQSPSGCGDFAADPRHQVRPGGKCDQNGWVQLEECGSSDDIRFGYCTNGPDCKLLSNRRLVTVHPEPNVWWSPIPYPQKHYCIDWEIPLPNFSTDLGYDGNDPPTPPTAWIHRERWPKFGKYEYIPPQRWIHAAEHGAMVFLYQPCLEEQWVRRIQDYAASIPPDAGGNFRYIITPYDGLRKKVSVVTWSRVHYMDCFNEDLFDEIYQRWYRRSWEDWPQIGMYNYLWQSWSYSEKTINQGCVKPLCPEVVQEPVCGTDGRTYPNPCFFTNARCVRPQLQLAFKGYCGGSRLSNQHLSDAYEAMDRVTPGNMGRKVGKKP